LKKLASALLIGLALAGCTRVDPGHVGVKVNRYGSSAGVETKALGVGSYWTLVGVDVYEYPIFTNNYVWSNLSGTEKGNTDPTKGTVAGSNEELMFQDKNGLVVSADVNVAFRVNSTLAPKLFQTYRVDMDGIVAGPLRNRVRSAIVSAASTMTVEEIYGPKKAELISRALLSVQRYFEPMGLHVDQLDWAGPIRIPENIMERINARAQTEQAAIAAQARVATVEAEGRAAVAEAEAKARAKIATAEGDAKATQVRNAAINANPAYTNEWMRKWDGHLPQTIYCAADKPCLNVGG
jgi:hypothetical protein